MFPMWTLSSYNYAGEIQDIAILPNREQKVGERLTLEGQFALRSALWKLTRIARIARPATIYDASVSDRLFEANGQAISHPIDSEGIADVNSAIETGDIKQGIVKDLMSF